MDLNDHERRKMLAIVRARCPELAHLSDADLSGRLHAASLVLLEAARSAVRPYVAALAQAASVLADTEGPKHER